MKTSVGISNVDRWKSSLWTDNNDNNGKVKKGGGIHAIGEKKVLIEKVKNLIILSERQGKWI